MKSKSFAGGLAATLCLAFLPAASLHGECCGTASAGLGGLLYIGDRLDDWSKHVGGGPPKVSIHNSGSEAVKVKFGGFEIPVLAGKTVRRTLVQEGIVHPPAHGEVVEIDMKAWDGVSPPLPGSQVQPSWDMGPQRPRKIVNKVKEKVDSGTCESCKANTTLPTGGGANKAEAQSDPPNPSETEPGITPANMQGAGSQTATSVNLSRGPASLAGQGSPAVATAVHRVASFSLGESAGSDMSDGVLVARGNPAEQSSYTLKGQNSTVGNIDVSPSPGEGYQAWKSSAGLMVLVQTADPGIGATVEIRAYHPTAFTVSYIGDVLTATLNGGYHKVTTLVELNPASGEGSSNPHLQNPSAFYTRGVLSSVELFNESSPDSLGTKHTTIWTGVDGNGNRIQGNRETLETPAGALKLVREETITHLLSLAENKRLEKLEVKIDGVLDEVRERTFRLFSWGEEVIGEANYPDGLESGPVYAKRFDWWDIPGNLTTQAQVDAAIEAMGLRYATLKMQTSLQGIVGGALNVGAWEAMWIQPDPDNDSQTLTTTLTPLWTGPSTPPDGSATIEDLENLPSYEVKTGKTWFAKNGKAVKYESSSCEVLLEKREDTESWEFTTAETVYADEMTSYLTRTERKSGSDFHDRPSVIYRVRANRTGYLNDGDLISRTRYRYEYAYPSGSAPADPNQAMGGGSSSSPYEVVWTTTRRFEGSDDDANRADATGDPLLKQCYLTEVETGNLLVERRYLATSEVDGESFNITNPGTLLETRVWTYDAAHRPLTLRINGVERESWSYTLSGFDTTVVHIDGDGVQTTEIQDALGRPTQRTLHGNTAPTNVYTKWTYNSRGAAVPGLITMVQVGNALSSPTWSRVTWETVDGRGRLTASTDPLLISQTYPSVMDSDGNRTETIVRHTSGGEVDLQAKTYLRDGSLYRVSGDGTVGGMTYSYPASEYTVSTVSFRGSSAPLYTGKTFRNALGDVTREDQQTGTGAWVQVDHLYDSSRRLMARSNPAGSAGGYWEVHRWEHLADGGHAHDSARSDDETYDSGDANRRRRTARLVTQAPYGTSVAVPWKETADYLPNAATGAWHGLPAAAVRLPLAEIAVAVLGGATAVPVKETVDGGMISTASLVRNRAGRSVIQRLYRLGGLARTTNIQNGLATTFTTPEMGSHTLAYSPLREPLAEASYETIPWWPVLTLDASTGQVLKRHLPKTTTANLTAPAFQTATYTYYPGNDISPDGEPRGGRVATVTETSTGGVTAYDYNARGQLTSQTGTGTYPQTFDYDDYGRRIRLRTWRSAGDNTTEAVTIWGYVGSTDFEDYKDYPPGQGNNGTNLRVDYTWNTGNQLSQRTTQRGVHTDYSYDQWGRLELVNYSDTTPDVKFEYAAHSGHTEKRHDGWGTAGLKVTTYSTRYDGSVTGETINDGGSSIALTRGYDSWGRLTSQGAGWTSGSGPAFPAITAQTQTFAYSSSQRLAAVYGDSTSPANFGGISFTKGSTGDGWTLSFPSNNGFYFTQNWNLDANGRASGHSGSYAPTDSGGHPVGVYETLLPTITQRWSGDRLAARSRGTDRRWEYRYNARGEVDSAWQQSNPAVTSPTVGETLAGTGTRYSYDAIGNRTLQVDGGQGSATAGPGPNGVASSTVAFTDQQNTTYTAAATNAANQYTSIAHPDRFNVRGTRLTGRTIAVNGTNIATPTPTPISGYQTGGTGTIFRAEVVNTAPAGFTGGTVDLYEPVTITQNGSVLTGDDPIQYVPPGTESLTYDADGNLKTDGRFTYTWDAADRLIKVESAAFRQFASPPLVEIIVPARVIEYGYDGLSRRIRKKVTETPPGGSSTIAVWEAYVYDGWNMVLSVKLNSAVGASHGRPQNGLAHYLWGPDLGSQPFARRDWQAAGGVRGLLMARVFSSNPIDLQLPAMDPMGNVTQVVRIQNPGSPSGYYGFPTASTLRPEFVYDYDAFGKETRSSSLVAGQNPDSFPFHYSTKFADPETGFNYYGYRFYDPANGRWINRDPIEEDGGLNLYGMVGNDGVNQYDELGLQPPPLSSLNTKGYVEAASRLADGSAGRAMNGGVETLKAELRRKALEQAKKQGPAAEKEVRKKITDEIAEETAARVKKQTAEQAAKCNRSTNHKHHPNSTSPEPKNVEELWKKAISDDKGVKWAKDADGTIHRFSKPSNGDSHWNGSTGGVDPIRLNEIPNQILKILK